jgi:hypothetical protein
MKYVTQIQTIIIFFLFALIAYREISFDKEALEAAKYVKHIDSVYYTHKDFIYYKPIIDSLENELFIKQIDIGRYESAIDYLDPKCKKQFESNCRE